ncbi:energy transducer TonB [bacterium]|nr:energy transducer TonB [bacterium]
MKRAILTMFVLLLPALLQAQNTDEADRSQYFDTVEEPPTIVGGISALAKNITYPKEAHEAGIEGTVIVEVLVSEQGKVDDCKVKRSPNDLLSEAALKAMREVTFNPGRSADKPVKCIVFVPVKFKLAPKKEDVDDK